MKAFILTDSSFNIALMDRNDPLHKEAVFIFQQFWKVRGKIKIILPPLCIYEIIATLKRKGINQKIIEEKILKLVNLKEVIVCSVSEIEAFKHCQAVPAVSLQEKALRTNDFMIVGIGVDYGAQIITFDRIMWEKTKTFYKDVYYCKDIGERKRFLDDLENRVHC